MWQPLICGVASEKGEGANCDQISLLLFSLFMGRGRVQRDIVQNSLYSLLFLKLFLKWMNKYENPNLCWCYFWIVMASWWYPLSCALISQYLTNDCEGQWYYFFSLIQTLTFKMYINIYWKHLIHSSSKQ